MPRTSLSPRPLEKPDRRKKPFCPSKTKNYLGTGAPTLWWKEIWQCSRRQGGSTPSPTKWERRRHISIHIRAGEASKFAVGRGSFLEGLSLSSFQEGLFLLLHQCRCDGSRPIPFMQLWTIDSSFFKDQVTSHRVCKHYTSRILPQRGPSQPFFHHPGQEDEKCRKFLAAYRVDIHEGGQGESKHVLPSANHQKMLSATKFLSNSTEDVTNWAFSDMADPPIYFTWAPKLDSIPRETQGISARCVCSILESAQLCPTSQNWMGLGAANLLLPPPQPTQKCMGAHVFLKLQSTPTLVSPPKSLSLSYGPSSNVLLLPTTQRLPCFKLEPHR
ncbi:uncharacterized protein LOC131204914 [Ahaetulla prasina]|uniref:uncharacterized protein LOC131204914 n=1 Tax=Ahaetulla prasina TaxID=499056 RepID=UPI002647C386|nr:uncharacterized protein LOC131204914 [Ahaetulla prasina]